MIHLSAIGEAARKLENVEGLTTGVRVSAKFQIMGSKQAMEMQMQQLQSQNSSNTRRNRSWRPVQELGDAAIGNVKTI